MKKLLPIIMGMSLALGSSTLVFGGQQDPPKQDSDKSGKKSKKDGKKDDSKDEKKGDTKKQ
ncbi:MAG: hypothetical protein LAP40_11005 [Acidobacteriia bacterium]|nr:hypothetical protein [Terriglobia bacterium]